MGEAKLRKEMGLGPKEVRQLERQFEVDLKNAVQNVCECGCKYFIPVLKLFTVSALLSPIGKEFTAQQPTLICMECKKPWEAGKETL